MTKPARIATAALTLVIIVALPRLVVARPGGGPAGGHPAGAMARPAGGAARPAAPAARPQMPAARPSMPTVRPQMPAARPQMPNMPNVSRPQPLQRPSLGGIQSPGSTRPGLPGPTARPSLPTAGSRPSMPATAARPGIGSLRPTATTRPAPAPGLSLPGAGGGRPTTLPGQVGGRPGGIAGPTTRPSFPQPGVGVRPGGPVTKPSFPQPGLGGTRPGVGPDRPSLGGVQRPTPPPGTLPGGSRPDGGNRPGIGGNRPGSGDIAGGATTLPGNLGPNRPGIGGDRPGAGGNRPGIGGNRPGIGDGNNLWNSGNINSGNWSNTINNVNVNRPWGGGGWAGGAWGYPAAGGWGYGGGWGYPGHAGGWAGAWHGGCVNPHYGWYNGCWGGGWWAPFAVGAATWGLASTVANWGLGYGAWGYNTAYANPYYSSIPATVVAASPYDYAQPVAVTTYATPVDAGATVQAPTETAPADTVTEAERVFDEALARFRAGDYTAALAACDQAVRLSPKDSIVHEVRALTLFALARYPEAAATLNAVLAAAPGMDWTTMSGLYGSVDAYTLQLRKLEEFCRTHPGDPAAHFVLAYHYLVGGHQDMAADALQVVVAKQPGDAVAKQLLAAIQPQPDSGKDGAAPAPEPSPAAAAPETDLVGTWQATAGDDTVMLVIKEDSTFTWKATPQGQQPVEISGTIETSRDAIALVSEKAGTMGGKVASKGPDAFEFTLAGGPPGAKPLLFQRQK